MSNLRFIEQVARSLGAEVHVKGNKIECTCLLAQWTHPKGYDKKPSMVIFPEGRKGDPIYSCQACHKQGSFRDLLCFIWSKTGKSMYPFIKILDSKATDDTASVFAKFSARNKDVKDLPDKGFMSTEKVLVKKSDKPWHDRLSVEEAEMSVVEIPWSRYKQFEGSVPRYALDRGLTIETCKAWKLGHNKKQKRLVFPLIDRLGRLVAFSGRLYADYCVYCGGFIDEVEKGVTKDGQIIRKQLCVNCEKKEPPKYLHSKGFKRNLFLYGENMIDQENRDVCYVVEGHFDALKLWQYGYRPIVALFGSYPGPVQVEKLIKFFDKIIVIPDGDKAGHTMGWKIKKMVADRIKVKVVKLPFDTDPGSLSKEECEKILGKPNKDVDKK
jgi:5S rRNA maturation endonuclease (ribonuclease M5)